jgi:hypothetical protein
MTKYINIIFDNDASLKKKLDLYYLVGPYFKHKVYPTCFNFENTITIDKNFTDEIQQLSSIEPVTKWNVFVIDATNHVNKIRKCYVAYQPILNKTTITKLSLECQCKDCINYKTFVPITALNENGIILNQSLCLKAGIVKTNVVFNTLDYINKTININNVLHRGSNILSTMSEPLNVIDFYSPYTYSNKDEFKIILENAWFYSIIKNPGINCKRTCGHLSSNHEDYNFINKWFIKTCVFNKNTNQVNKGLKDNINIHRVGNKYIDLDLSNNSSDDIWYLVFPSKKEIFIINKEIQSYCQCRVCKAGRWNPFKYIFKTKQCLKVDLNLWDIELHKKTLSAYTKDHKIPGPIN